MLKFIDMKYEKKKKCYLLRVVFILSFRASLRHKVYNK